MCGRKQVRERQWRFWAGIINLSLQEVWFNLSVWDWWELWCGEWGHQPSWATYSNRTFYSSGKLPSSWCQVLPALGGAIYFKRKQCKLIMESLENISNRQRKYLRQTDIDSQIHLFIYSGCLLYMHIALKIFMAFDTVRLLLKYILKK